MYTVVQQASPQRTSGAHQRDKEVVVGGLHVAVVIVEGIVRHKRRGAAHREFGVVPPERHVQVPTYQE